MHEEIHGTDFLCLFLEDTDKFLTDDFTFLLRLGDTGKFLIITFLGVDTDKVQLVVAIGTEDLFHFVSFILPQQAVIHKHTGQLVADGLRQHDGSH